MNRKKYLTESIEDFGRQIVNNVYDTLTQWDYEQSEIDSIVGRDSIELDIADGECVLHCGNEVIYSTPSNVLIHKFAPAAEEALLNWCIKKIGREPESLDADDLFGDIPGWNNLNEAYGTDFEDTLAWVQKKFPNKSEKEQHQFAKNIMKRYVAPDETNSTDVVEKPKTRKNVKLIKIVDIPNHGRHQDVYCKSLLLRTARKPGDTERVNHTVLGRLNAAGVKYEIIDENKNMTMNKKNTINEARRPANKQVGQHLFKGLRYDSNGNPLYTCDTLSNEEAQAMGWKFSPKYGLYGQLSDPTMFYESKKRSIKLTESELKSIITESVRKILRESIYDVNDEFTSSMTNNMAVNNMQQQTSNFRHVKYLDPASRKAIVDRINKVCTTEDGYFDADQYRLEKEFNMSSDEMEKKGIWDIVRNMIEIALDGGYLY